MSIQRQMKEQQPARHGRIYMQLSYVATCTTISKHFNFSANYFVYVNDLKCASAYTSHHIGLGCDGRFVCRKLKILNVFMTQSTICEKDIEIEDAFKYFIKKKITFDVMLKIKGFLQ